MYKIVFLDRATFAQTISINKPVFEHEWIEYESTEVQQIINRCSDADVIITNKVPLKEEVLKQLKKLKFIAVAATGYDCIDLEACKKLNILVSNVRGYGINSVPEHVFSLIFALKRSLIGYRDDVINGEWQKAKQFCFHTHSITDLKGSTLGIVGQGGLGKAVGNIGKALGMNVIYAERKDSKNIREGYTQFDKFLKESDIISLNCPLTNETRNLLTYKEFQKMSRTPLIINCGRGGLVNEVDIVKALNEKLISGIGFDCLTSEPINNEHPFCKILNLPNVIVTPHVAWASEEAMQTLWNKLIENINNFKNNKPSNILN
ncbi:D-2-hydroxyacid dehydrogenase [Arcobacter sp.]|uniref:D-2-hydroxyacid dehydrogenase n=1 Tax=Arcobacter sp. TaxID=1872629 RepID=UPI003C75CE66